MRAGKLAALVWALAPLSYAEPASRTWHSFSRRNSSACAQVSISSAAQASATAIPQVDGQLAYDCLNSVALHKPEALALMDAIMPYVEWQTDVSYLKDPPAPPAYLEPAVDIIAAINAVKDKIENGTYANEYQFQADLFRTYNLAHDGHFRFFPDLLTGALNFTRGVSVVSVSMNGSDIPKIYVHSDIEDYVAGKYTPSSITTINGEDAVKFLEDWSQLGALNDPDALYNSVFFSKPFAAESLGWKGYFAGSGRFGYIWPGSNTTIGFQTGTTNSYVTTAGVIGDFTGVTDGESFYQQFCTGPKSSDSAAATTASVSSAAPGYPEPVIISSDNYISGYFLNSSSTSDVAVLSMLTFEPDVPAEFQYVMQTFIADAKAAGKTKLVIDVSANGGGYILQGYDTFRQLFPQIVQDGYTRYRYTEALQLMADQYAMAIPANYSPATASNDLINMYESTPNYKYDYNLEDKHFKSIQEKFGPYEFNGDNFTNIIRWDLNDPLTTVNSTYGMGMEITGYGSRRNFTQPFATEDIIILYDGYCASTCTLFSEFMRTQAGVKSIAIGGRPSTDPMQGIGGVKGANNDGYDYINYLAQLAYNSGTPEQQQWANWTVLTNLTLLPTNRSTDTSVNVRDNILPSNLEEGLPAQFVYEAADCRLFYEPAMIVDVSKMWEAAADAAWGSKKCVQGGLDLKKRHLTTQGKKKAAAAAVQRRELPEFEPLAEYKWRSSVHGQKVPS